MANKVLKPFFDKTDNLKPYKIGDTYSHKDSERIAFLFNEGFIEKSPPAKKRTTRKKASE